jgi:3-dehydroquinate synthase
MSQTVTVALADRSYPIHIGPGLLARAGELLKPLARGPLPVVTDSHVGEMHLAGLLNVLGEAGLDARPIVLEPGEATKSFAGLESLTTALLHTGVDRSGLVVAFGGGVIGDLTGFAAGVLKRGIALRRSPRRFSHKWIPRSAARPRSTRPRARISSVCSISRGSSSRTPMS